MSAPAPHASLSPSEQQRMCERKHRYVAEIQALIEAAKYRNSTTPQRAYQCPVCGGWHLTKLSTYSGTSRPRAALG